MQMPNDLLGLDSDKPELTESAVLDQLGDDNTEAEEEIKLEDKSSESKDDDKVNEEEEDEPEAKSEKSDEESDEDKIELKDEEVDEYVELPSRKSILKTYPEFFKKFPGVERAMYREKEYTETFPTIAEAKQAKERLEVFHNIENDLFSGTIDNLLSSVKKQDEKAFKNIAGNLLSTLEKVDKESYYGTVNQVLSNALDAVFQKGKGMGDDDGEQLMIAARLINRAIYGSTEIKPVTPNKVEEKEDPKIKELSEREQQFNKRQLDTAVQDVTNRTRSTVESAINKYIDPKSQMTDYVRSKAVTDVLSQLDKEISSDSRFRQHVDLLWKDAAKNNYSDESRSRIRKAIIARAQTILPDVIRKVRADAIKGLGGQPKRKTVEREEPETRTERREAPPSKSREQTKIRASNVRDVMKFLEG
jgi:hypothetical protein